MKKSNPAFLKTGSLNVLASSTTFDKSQTTLTIVNHAYVIKIVMTKWYILGFTLKYADDDFFARKEKGWGSPLPPSIYSDVSIRMNSTQIPFTQPKSIQSLTKNIKKSLRTQLNYSTVYNDILVAIAQYNIRVDELNHLTNKMKISMQTTTRTNRNIRKCRGPIKNYKVKINSSMSGARDISHDPNNVLTVLCEFFPYLQKVINI